MPILSVKNSWRFIFNISVKIKPKGCGQGRRMTIIIILLVCGADPRRQEPREPSAAAAEQQRRELPL